MIGFDEAIARLGEVARPLGPETVPLEAAAGRVLAKPVHAMIRAPSADVSTMDGYAVRDADLAALPARLRVAGEAGPGQPASEALQPGTCLRIFTGGPLPKGADRVVIQEVVGREGELVHIEQPPGDSRFVRAAGSDFGPGDLLLEQGEMVTPRALVAAAAGDADQLTVWRRPMLYLIATGDELAAPGEARHYREKVPDSISAALAAFARNWGADVAGQARMPDDLERLTDFAGGIAEKMDVIVVTGGASVGPHDHGRAMFGDRLDLIFSQVAIKPGKPVWLGRVGSAIVLGLPGNPGSALVTARLFLAPLLAGLAGRDLEEALRWRLLPLAEPFGPTGDRETFSRGFIDHGQVRLLANQDSGAQSALARATLLVRRRIGSAGLGGGEMVEVLDF